MGLIHKLRDIGCSETLNSYLFNRMQRVVFNGQTSEWTYIKADVPQGSILGPLLFLIYINNIVHELRASVRLFADDTTLYIIVENINTAGAILNSHLNRIDIWGADWLVDFNAAKTLSMIFETKSIRPSIWMEHLLQTQYHTSI